MKTKTTLEMEEMKTKNKNCSRYVPNKPKIAPSYELYLSAMQEPENAGKPVVAESAGFIISHNCDFPPVVF